MWCPKCRYEYRKGIKVCADCGCELVESLDDVLDLENNAETEEYKSGRTDTRNIGDETEDKYFSDEMGHEGIDNDEDAFDENAGGFNDSGNDGDGTDNSGDEAAKQETAEPAYVPKRTRYEDNKSSAYTFFLVGGVGAVLVILHITGVIDFNLSPMSKLLTNTVMGALFAIFLIVGIVSAKNSAKYKKEALAEEALTGQIKSFIRELYTTEGIDKACGAEDETEAYGKWNLRYHFIENQIAGEYPELAVDYLEYITDMIYNELYEE